MPFYKTKAEKEATRTWADWERAFQEIAFKNLHSIQTWFRMQYNLPPTDERYLNASLEEMYVDFWQHQLLLRWVQAKKDGADPKSLDDLLNEENFDAQLAALDENLEKEAKADLSLGVQRAPAEYVRREEDRNAMSLMEESFIDFKAPRKL